MSRTRRRGDKEAHDAARRPSPNGALAGRESSGEAVTAIHQLLPVLSPGDAIGQAVRRMRASFLEAGAGVRVLLEEGEIRAGEDMVQKAREARMADIARRLGVAHPTVSKSIARLKREGLATARPYRGIFLTEAGLAMAKSVRQRHRLVVELLVAVGAPREAAEADAEGIEHYVSAATLRAFEAFLREDGRR